MLGVGRLRGLCAWDSEGVRQGQAELEAGEWMQDDRIFGERPSSAAFLRARGGLTS
jgi:hypothetical protein